MTNTNDAADRNDADRNGPDRSEPDRNDHDRSDPDGTNADVSSSADIDPEEMSLEELRREIRGIDREIVELIARRTYVADTIAQVKVQEGLPTVDEEQESRVMERAGHNAEQFDVDANLVKAIFRLLIELNKVEQRERR